MKNSAPSNDKIDHLFRHESGKMVAVLTKLFGFDQLEVAEDLVQDTFIRAFESWKFNGTPDDPLAWLYTVAKNKATDYVRRQQTRRKVDDVVKTAIPVEYTITAQLEQAFHDITDSQLQLLFGVCHPAIPEEAQLALALKTLGGFGIQEIASAFLTNKEVINKRLFRAKQKIRKENIRLEIPSPNQLSERTGSVLKTIYLMYNEGYHSSSQEAVIRKDLCLEAMRLALLLEQSDLPITKDCWALLALMCFHTSRFECRLNELGDLIPWSKQDHSKWNQELIEHGLNYLQRLNLNELASAYELEAAIAYFHTMEDHPQKWEGLLALYRRLSKVKASPMVLLNETYVLSKVAGANIALEMLDSITELHGHYLYFAVKGEILINEDPVGAIKALEKAIALAPLEAEKKILREKQSTIT
ncbi:MAG: sigma-70 family RNA polymerase sigma factor [Cytophagales bacterium]|nr:sigma-70 family RNA polymerase sigma factor [Cytophagales bacterium]